jgi:hypothetical protein
MSRAANDGLCGKSGSARWQRNGIVRFEGFERDALDERGSPRRMDCPRGSDDAVEPPPGAEVLGAQGSFLMPGLWDNHQHFEGVHGALDLACGVTSARDMANDTDVFLGRVARFDVGTELGPRVFKAGVIDGNGPGAAPTNNMSSPENRLLPPADELLRAIRGISDALSALLLQALKSYFRATRPMTQFSEDVNGFRHATGFHFRCARSSSTRKAPEIPPPC